MESAQRRIARIIVEGRVQGVGFRAFVAREAARLHLSGWARNRRDGSVEIVAAGPSAAIDRLAAAARRGPSASRVDTFHLEEADETALRETGAEGSFVTS